MKLLLASDLHYIPDLTDEINSNQHRLPANTYNHKVDGKLYWHNQMMVEDGERLLDGLEALARQEQPDLLIFLGDMVNINWEKSIAGVAARFATFPCPVRQVTGNHDIYLRGAENRLQDAVTPGSYQTGLRHEILHSELGDELGLLYIDLFTRNAQGEHRKWGDPTAKESVEYRPEDVFTALEVLASAPQTPWLILAHFPFLAPESRVDLPGRKMGRVWPSGTLLAAHLQEANNLMGILCGHQHFAHFQRFDHGFHWTLPPLVEYPCAAALVEWDGTTLAGHTLVVDRELAAESLRARNEAWTAGEGIDQSIIWQHNSTL